MPFTDHPALWLTVLLLDAGTIVRALLRRHSVESTWAWVLAVLAFPVVGALAYVALGNPEVQRARIRRKRRRSPSPPPGPLESVLRLAAALTKLPVTGGNRVELLAHDQKGFQRIEECVAGAKTSIWAEYYIVSDDDTGRRFLDQLADAAARGVEVRLLYDAVGSSRIDRARVARLRAAGGEVAVFHPFLPVKRRWSLMLRNHRKLVVVDGTIGFTGGMNVGDEYSGRFKSGGRNFRDTHLELTGPAVADLSVTFAEDWQFATEESVTLPSPAEPQPAGTATVAVIPSGPDQDLNASLLAFFACVTEARKRVWITSPYFIPDDATVRALVAAALGGVDVRILVPAQCDVPIVGSVGRFHFLPLARAGVRLFEYLPSMLHAKTLIVDDDLSYVGSANVDIRSFRLNFEIGALVKCRRFTEKLAARFEENLAQSREIRREDLEHQSFVVRLKTSIARLLSPLL